MRKQSDLDWLQGEIQPRIFGDYTPIKKDYLIDDFIEDVVDFGVEQSVYINAIGQSINIMKRQSLLMTLSIIQDGQTRLSDIVIY